MIKNCPCFKCIVFTLCKQKAIQTLIKECHILREHLILRVSGMHIVLSHDKLLDFCNLMDITITKKGNNHIITYNGRNVI